MRQTTTQIQIGSVGVMDISLPLISIETNIPGPKLVFIAGQHGGEITPMFVLQQLNQLLQKNPLVKGSLSIIPVANPLGLLLNRRQEPLDGEDLNRMFPGATNKNLPKRITANIFNLCLDADLVVDLHTFSRQCLLMGVMIKTDNPPLQDKIKNALRTIAPKYIWQINLTRREDQRFLGSLDIILTQKNIPAITLEMPPISLVRENDINDIATSLLRLLNQYQMVASTNLIQNSQQTIPIYEVSYLYSETSGLFYPRKKVMDTVDVGEIIGEISNLRDFSRAPATVASSGTIMTILPPAFVRTGSKIGSIGTQVDVL